LASTGIEVSGLGYAVGGVEILKCVDAGMPALIPLLLHPTPPAPHVAPRALNDATQTTALLKTYLSQYAEHHTGQNLTS
jgi:hypothetical protein